MSLISFIISVKEKCEEIYDKLHDSSYVSYTRKILL